MCCELSLLGTDSVIITGNVSNRYLDDHELWTSTDFAVHCFKLIVNNVQVTCTLSHENQDTWFLIMCWLNVNHFLQALTGRFPGHCLCESSLFSSDECRVTARSLPTLRPCHPTCAESSLATVHIHYHHLLVLISPKADTHFTIQRRMEGWIDPRTAVKVCSPCPRLYSAVAVMINTTAHGETQTWVLLHHSCDCICFIVLILVDNLAWSGAVRLCGHPAADESTGRE